MLLHHKLLPPRQLSGQKGIQEVFCLLRSIQFDPLKPCGNNVDLVLQSRIKDIHPGDYYKWLYIDHKGVEVLDKEMCIMPIEDMGENRRKSSEYGRKRIEKFLKEHKENAKTMLDHIRERGETSSSDIEDERKIGDWWGGSTRLARVTLEMLWLTGKLAISNRKNGRKYYDLPERVYGNSFIWNSKIENQSCPTSTQIMRRIASIGLLSKSGGGSGWLGLSKSGSTIIELINGNHLTEIKIEGLKKSYIIPTYNLALLEKAKRLEDVSPEISFIAPLDNLIWDRHIIEDIFGFHYRWEVYTPQMQRKFGYYALPILFGDQFIGRIEPRKIGDTLEIRGLWLEQGVYKTPELKRAFQKAIKAFSGYLNTKETIWNCDNCL